MPRLKNIDPASASGRAKELFDGPLKGKHFNIFKGMANSPAVLDAYVALSGAMSKASLSVKEREAIALAVSQANSCEYCQAAHTAIGKGGGLTDEQAVQARRGEASDPRLAALIRFALALHEKKGWVSDKDVAEFRGAGFNDGQIAEVVGAYVQTIFGNYFNHLNQTEVDFPQVPKI